MRAPRRQHCHHPHYNGHAIEFREPDGYLNLTSLCRAYNLRPNDFLNLTYTKRTLSAWARKLKALPENLVTVVQGGDTTGGIRQGTWIHPKLAAAACRWVSVDFEIWCDETIRSIMDGKKQLVDVIPEASAMVVMPTYTESLRLNAEYTREIYNQAVALEAAQQVIQVVQDEKLLLELDVLIAEARTEQKEIPRD